MNNKDISSENILENFVEVDIPPENFLKIKETLQRIGIASKQSKTLFQTAFILHKQNHYYITHFKEMFMLDGRETNITSADYIRRNIIAKLLEDFGLLKIVNRDIYDTTTIKPMLNLKILSYKDAKDWKLVPKYTIGKFSHKQHEDDK